MDERPLTIKEAAVVLGMSRWTLRDRVTAGTVPHRRTGKVRGVVFDPEHIEQIKQADTRPALGTPSRSAARTRHAARTSQPSAA
ncbi:helix-turn-helix transcriptional regulator [Micromonospora humida]|uniref:helix-turn-helix transcriptional regulator n=1 Tax=Micromonospora humida TaxID=2809018 RepID=UPI00341C56FC